MNNRKVWLLVSITIFISVAVLVLSFEDETHIEQKHAKTPPPSVTTLLVEPQNHPRTIQTYAEVKPRWSTTLRAQVSGTITRVFEPALAGSTVKKGALLIQIEDSAYLAAVHEAELAVAEAELNLLQEQKKAEQAQKDWQRSGIAAKPSTLLLNEPQRLVAEKMRLSAQSHLKAVQKNFIDTKIKAPYSGMVITRHVSVGQSVIEGDALLDIIHVDHLELAIALDKPQWAILDKGRHNAAQLYNLDGDQIGTAEIKRGGHVIDTETRLHTLYLEVKRGEQVSVLPGDFIQVHLPAGTLTQSLAIPASALSRNGQVWYLDDQNHLRAFTAVVHSYQNDQAIIDTPKPDQLQHYPNRWRIATMPLASFVAGKLVTPKTREEK